MTEKNLPFGKWERFYSIVKYKRTVAFLLRWLPSHKHFRSSILEITDPFEMDNAEQKLIYLSQGEAFPSELKLLRAGKVNTRNSRIAKYSPFIEIILEYIENQSRCSKIDTDIEKCKKYIEQAVEIKNGLIDMAAKSANPDKLIPAQDMWLHKLTQSNNKFLEWHSGLHLLGSLTISRSYFTEPLDRIELHMFGDSSQDVFCAVAFLRARLASSHQIELAVVFGKARVAPMKALSIPKLKLQAALLPTRLKEEILKGFTFKVTDIFMWTDSTTVLQWLHSCSSYRFCW